MNRLVPSTLSIRIPFAVRKRGGRKLVITPDGETHRPRPRVDSALVKALARAHRWQRMLESGEYSGLTELAAAEKINLSYQRHHPLTCAHSREVIEAMRCGIWRSAFQASQQTSTMAW